MGANFGIILNASIVILDCSPNAIKPPWHFISFSTHLGIENLKNHLAQYIYIYFKIFIIIIIIILPIFFFGKNFQVQKLPHSILH